MLLRDEVTLLVFTSLSVLAQLQKLRGSLNVDQQMFSSRFPSDIRFVE